MPNHFFGWRPSLPDRRDRKFSVPPSVLASLPPAVDLTAGMSPVLDQGGLGSCGPNSLSSLIQYDQKAQGLSVVAPSRLFLYYNTRSLMNTVDSDSGVDNRSMLKALARWGFCDEGLWPYSDGPTKFKQKPPQPAYDAGLPNKVTDYSAVDQTAVTMKGCLAAGRPFLFGFTVYESFESAAVEATGVVPMPGRREAVLGGHDVCIVGYDDSKGRWKFKNSWGVGWGVDGYGWFPTEYVLSPDLSSDFWSVTTIPGGVVPVPPPTPTPTPPAGPTTISFPDGTTATIPAGAWKATASP